MGRWSQAQASVPARIPSFLLLAVGVMWMTIRSTYLDLTHDDGWQLGIVSWNMSLSALNHSPSGYFIIIAKRKPGQSLSGLQGLSNYDEKPVSKNYFQKTLKKLFLSRHCSLGWHTTSLLNVGLSTYASEQPCCSMENLSSHPFFACQSWAFSIWSPFCSPLHPAHSSLLLSPSSLQLSFFVIREEGIITEELHLADCL